MKTSWVIGMVMLFITLSLISGLVENAYIGASVTGRLEMLLLQGDTLEEIRVAASSAMGVVSVPVAIIGLTVKYLFNLWGMFWFDYAQFAGGWAIVRYLFCCVSVGMVYGLVMAIRGVPSG